MAITQSIFEETVAIDAASGMIYGTLSVPEQAWGAVLFAHGTGSSRHSPRNRLVAQALHDVGLATLVIDLLTLGEERIDAFTARHRFNIDLLTDRLCAATDWLEHNCAQHHFRIGYFGASTGAAAVLRAAAERPDIAAIVCRGGRPDLAGDALSRVEAATLLIVGALDRPVIRMNREAYEELQKAYRREVIVIPGATHLFEEPGSLDEVARHAELWFVRYLGAAVTRARQANGKYADRSNSA